MESMIIRVSYRILSWGGGGGEQDGSRMIVECKSSTRKCACLLGGLGACSPRKILNLDPLGLLLTQSGTRLLFNTCDKTIVTILNFKISGRGGGGGGEFQGPPLYETLIITLMHANGG